MQRLLEGVPAALNVHSNIKINLEANQGAFKVSHARLEVSLRELHPLRSSGRNILQLVHDLLLRDGHARSHLLLVGDGRVDQVELLHLTRVSLHVRQQRASRLSHCLRSNLLVENDAGPLEVLLVEDQTLQLLRLALGVNVERNNVVRIVDVVSVFLRVNLRLVVLDVRLFTAVIDSRLLITAVDSLSLLVVLVGTLCSLLVLLISVTVLSILLVTIKGLSVFGGVVLLALQLVTHELLLDHAQASIGDFLRASDGRRLVGGVALSVAGR